MMEEMTITMSSGKSVTLLPGDTLTIGDTKYTFEELRQLANDQDGNFTVDPAGAIDSWQEVKK